MEEDNKFIYIEENEDIMDMLNKGSDEEKELRRLTAEKIRKEAEQKRTSTQKIEETRRKSLNIEPTQSTLYRYPASRRKEKKITLTKKELEKRLKVIAVLSATMTLCLAKGISSGIDDYKKRQDIIKQSNEFYKQVVMEEKHPTENHKYFYYDYSDIGKKIMTMVNIDEAVYYLIKEIGEEPTNSVLETTPYKSLQVFIISRGYQDVKEFKKEIEKKIQLELEIERNRQELDEMQKEHSKNDFAKEVERSK